MAFYITQPTLEDLRTALAQALLSGQFPQVTVAANHQMLSSPARHSMKLVDITEQGMIIVESNWDQQRLRISLNLIESVVWASPLQRVEQMGWGEK